jgi:hypothetical protein
MRLARRRRAMPGTRTPSGKERLMSSSIKFAAGLTLTLFFVAGCAKDKDESDATARGEGPKPSYFEERAETTTATVEAIDQATGRSR